MTARPANCAYLHSAFGPGCPYCHQARADRALDRQAISAAADEPDPAGESQP